MISAVINTLNAEKTVERALRSVKPWVDEIVVVDMHSDDATVDICRRYTHLVFPHERTGYVEPARNFAIDKAAGPFILVIDADEEATPELMRELAATAGQDGAPDVVRIPMRSQFLGRWMTGGAFWPDYHVRFFKKEAVRWQHRIHSFPETSGTEISLRAEQPLALRHYFCGSISDFVRRIDAYTDREAQSLLDNNSRLPWNGLLRAPVKEFCKRFFKFRGHADGVHGMIHALLMAFYGFLSYAKAYERRELTNTEAPEDAAAFVSEAGRELQKAFLQVVASFSRCAKGFRTGVRDRIRLRAAYLFASVLRK